MNIICPSCRKETQEGNFCGYCGAKIPQEEVSSKVDREGDISKPSDSSKEEDGTIILRGEQESPETFPKIGDETIHIPERREPQSTPSSKAHPPSFGKYKVIGELGRGAMGIVYLAKDETIQREVAVKALHIDPILSDEEQKEIRERFIREARAAGSLSHPNVVVVHDVGEEGRTPYIVMEYLKGATLRELIYEGPLPIKQAENIISQVLSALAYAHAEGIVHRDIKPDNIFILPDGRVKVADFGIAHISSSSTLTSAGRVLGTPGYMSPEQVKGEVAGPQSDIFSCGVLLYEMLTGKSPFRSSSPTSILYKIVHEEPELPHLLNPEIPAYLEAVIMKACAKNPSDRYTDALEMEKDIEEQSSPTLATSSPDQTILRAPALTESQGTILRGEPIPAVAAPLPRKEKNLSGRKPLLFWGLPWEPLRLSWLLRPFCCF